MNAFATVAGAFAAVITIAVVLGLVLSLPVMWLWNGCLVPAAPKVLVEISWLQAWGILVLCSFLFKSSASKD